MKEKRGDGKQRFLKGEKLGQEMGALKRGKAGTPLRTLTLYIEKKHKYQKIS